MMNWFGLGMGLVIILVLKMTIYRLKTNRLICKIMKSYKDLQLFGYII